MNRIRRISAKSPLSRTNGFTLIELLITLGIFAMMLAVSVSGIRSFFTRMTVTNGLRTITCAFNSARHLSIGMNKRIKVTLSGQQMILMEMKNNKWQSFKTFELDQEVSASMNASPVFSPYGDVAPLCTVTVICHMHRYKITISMAGRLLVSQQ